MLSPFLSMAILAMFDASKIPPPPSWSTLTQPTAQPLRKPRATVAQGPRNQPTPARATSQCKLVFRDPEQGGMPDWKWGNVGIIREQWKDTKDGEIAVAVAYAEHGLNCTGVSPTNDHGLFQLHGIAEYDCKKNAAIGYGMYLRRGFQPWVAYKTGKYKRYLTCA